MVNLGYSEFQDDEIDSAQVAIQTILGDKQALLADTRGPARTMLAASFFLYSDRVGEIDARWPNAVASVASILATFCLGRRLFGPTVGLLAAAMVAVEGITVGYGRISELENAVNLMSALAVLCFVLAREIKDRRALIYHALGSLFFAVGLLAHYEAALLAPVLLWLWISRDRGKSFRSSWLPVLISAIILLLTAASFYVPFVLNPQFRQTMGYYGGDVLGRGLADNLAQFLSASTFYNSVYLVAPLVLLLIYACARALARRSRWLGWACGLASLGLWTLGILYPGQFAAAGIIWCVMLVVLLLATVPDEDSLKIVLCWFMLYFVPYIYIVKVTHVHFYTFTTPWALAAGYGLYQLWQALESRIVRVGLAAGLTACFSLAIYHDVVMFVSHTPEWAMVQPDQPLALHPRLHAGRPAEYFGFPHKSGWQTIAALYRAGLLRGPYQTNELYQKADWYLRRTERPSGANRYYFLTESPHRLQAGPAPEPFIGADYWPIGEVTVAGQPKIRMFQRKDGTLPPPQPVTYVNEHFEATPGAVRPLDTYRLWRDYQADDQFYRQVGQHLENEARPGDGLILSAPAQAELLSLQYRGQLPYYALPGPRDEGSAPTPVDDLETAVRTHPRLLALWWADESADPSRRIERWLDEHLFKADERWFGNLRLSVYANPPESTRQMDLPLNVRIGDRIKLLGYGLLDTLFRSGEVLPLRLFWQTTDSLSERYKVFVHVLDPQGQVAAQRDSEPAGGSRPTDRWQPGEVITDNHGIALPAGLAPGQYEIVAGLYDPATGARQPAVDPQGRRLPNDRIDLGKVEVIQP